ncbi:MAG: glutamine amidotransferase [Phycisphaeraceae bacterium]
MNGASRKPGQAQTATRTFGEAALESVYKFRTALLPPSRQPVSAASIAPLLIFLLVFIGGCLLLDYLHVIFFSRLWPFWFVLVMPWIWWMHVAGYAGLTRSRSVIALIARLTLLGLFIILLTEPRAVRSDKGLSVIFVVDASASIHEDSRTGAIEWVLKMVNQKPKPDDHAGLIFFGRSAAVELPPQPVLPYDDKNTVMNVQIDHDGTDISKALSLAAALAPKDRNVRFVLISDGVETEGSLSQALDELKSKDIAVDTYSVGYSYEDEVWLEELQMPRFVKSGETYNATVILSSLRKGKGKLTLTENGQIIFQQDVPFDAGKNRFDLPIYLKQPGFYEYRAHIDVPNGTDATGKVVRKDFKAENNQAVNHIYLRGKGRILVVVDRQGEPLDYQPFVDALTSAQREVDVKGALEFPRDASALMPYDAVVFANVPAADFDAQQLEAVHESVYAQGTGFLMIGGVSSYGPGGYHKTAIERVLPVSMDLSQKKVLPKGALIIILHTCEFPQGNTWAKNITKQAMKVLNERDEVGALAQDFGGADYWIFNLSPAGMYNQLSQKLNGAELGDMMSFGPTMQMGFNALKASDASAKHMILISDGDAQPPSPQLLQSFVDNKISITTVSVFPHGGTNGPETQLMSNIAKLTGGRHHVPQNPNQLPAIFIKEATTLRRSSIQEIPEGFTPNVGVSSNILEGITTMPKLTGYVLTTPKAKSLTILDGPEEEEVDPVLSTWRYGLGATAAWTSDLSPKWAAQWMGWEKYQAFVKQLVSAVSNSTDEGALRMRTFISGGQGVIIVEDYSEKDSFLVMEAQVSGPRALDKTVQIKQVAPNRYEGRFPLAGEGTYRVAAAAIGEDGKPQRVAGRLVMPYSQEYLRFRANPIVLQQIAERTGGRELSGLETGDQVFLHDGEPKRSSRPIVDWFLILLCCAVPLDVGLRRVQIDFETIKGWLAFRKDQPNEETFSKLRKRKEEVADTMRKEDDVPPRRAPKGTASVMDIKVEKKPEASAAPRSQPSAPAADESSPMSATERLLAAKKRAQEQQQRKEEDS